MKSVGRLSATHAAGVRAHKREDLVRDQLKHVARSFVLEVLPAKALLVRGENGVFDRLAEEAGVLFLLSLDVIKTADEQEVGNLLDGLHGIGYAARVEGQPNAINLILDVTSNHEANCSRGRGLVR